MLTSASVTMPTCTSTFIHTHTHSSTTYPQTGQLLGPSVLVLICDYFPERIGSFLLFLAREPDETPGKQGVPPLPLCTGLSHAHANANQPWPSQGSVGRLPGTGEQTFKECYFISGILGKEGRKREVGQWNKLGGERKGDRSIMNVYNKKSEEHEKEVAWIKGLVCARNCYLKLSIEIIHLTF